MTQFEKRCAVVIIVLLLSFSIGTALAQPSAPHLVNGDFEGGFSYRGASEVEVANGWDPAWLQSDRQCPSPCHRPEYKPEQQIIVSGYSQRWFTTFARQFATIYQRVDVTPGQWYEFSCDAYAISEPDGQMGVFVGINPWGGDPFHRTMIWGREQEFVYRQWIRVSVTAQAWSNRITVAAAGNNNWPTKNNAAYWDNCTIKKVEQGTMPPTPEPCPTCVPGPGGECDYDIIREIVRDREPVRWPR